MKTIGLIFRSLYSNQAVIDSRKNKWYVALCIFVLSIFLPWIPSLSKGYTSNTASFLLATQNYDIDKGFKATLNSDYFKNGVLIKKDSEGSYYFDYKFSNSDFSEVDSDFDNEYNGTNSKALYKGKFADETSSQTSDFSHLRFPTSYCTSFSHLAYEYYFDNISVTTSDAIEAPSTSTSSSTSSDSVEYETGINVFMENFYIPQLSMKTENYSKFLNNFVASVMLEMKKDETKANRYPHSYTIWAKDFVMVAVYPLRASKSSIQVAASYSGDINSGFDGATIEEGTSFYKYLSNDGELDISKVYQDSLVNYFHQAGRPAYIRSVWVNIGILSAIVAGCVLVASLLLLWFNKKKTSVYRDSNYWNCLNEAIYFSLTPSLIGMIFGFFNAQMVNVIIIGANLMRVVFSMNRICPPPMDNGGGNKPLYEARS